MVKMIESLKLDTSKLRDLAGSLRALAAKSLELVPILEDFAKPLIQGYVISAEQMKWRREGGIDALEDDLAVLQAALKEVRSRIKPALKTLKKSLQ